MNRTTDLTRRHDMCRNWGWEKYVSVKRHKFMVLLDRKTPKTSVKRNERKLPYAHTIRLHIYIYTYISYRVIWTWQNFQTNSKILCINLSGKNVQRKSNFAAVFEKTEVDQDYKIRIETDRIWSEEVMFVLRVGNSSLKFLNYFYISRN